MLFFYLLKDKTLEKHVKMQLFFFVSSYGQSNNLAHLPYMSEVLQITAVCVSDLKGYKMILMSRITYK